MAGEWCISSLAEAPLEIIDGDRGVNYPKQEEFSGAGHCLFLNAGNVSANGFNFSDCAFITAQKDAALRKGKLVRNDVVLTTRGTVGNSAFFDRSVPFDHIRINSGMVILRPLPEYLHPRYLYLFVRSPLFHSQVAALRTGSAQPQLPIRDINRMEILVPPLPEQRAIAHILGTLDDKIELNRRMSETLEAMARALFKSWFVDFDPVRAKMNHPSTSGRGAGGEGRVWGEGHHCSSHAYPPTELRDFARALRNNQTDAEHLMWRMLRDRSIAGAKFRRQHPVPPYVLDFYCHELKLAIELDGGQHGEATGSERDRQRDTALSERGITVLRFWNNEVLNETEAVLEQIYRTVTERVSPSPGPSGHPLPMGEGWGEGVVESVAFDHLFPAHLVDSELGEIPEGWKVQPFAAIVEIIGGGTPKTSVPEYWNGDIPWFSIVDAPNGADVWVVDTEKKITREGVENSSTRILPVGTTIISARGTVGRIALAGVPMAMNQSCYALQGKKDRCGFFTYFATQQLVASLRQHAHGSVFDTITRDTLAGVSVAAPPAEMIEAFETCVGPSMERIRAGLCESRTLVALRDALLPKLISGELRTRRLSGRATMRTQ